MKIRIELIQEVDSMTVRTREEIRKWKEDVMKSLALPKSMIGRKESKTCKTCAEIHYNLLQQLKKEKKCNS